MKLTIQQLQNCIPTNQNAKAWIDPLNAVLAAYDINTPKRIAAFLSQTAHESNDFKSLTENLNYSAASLLATWPSRFPSLETALPYQRNPEAIANKVYANRLGNTEPGDGWRYRGRSLIQLTGKANYEAAARGIGLPPNTLTSNPDLLTTPEYALKSAAWFWKSRGCNELADAENIKAITQVINGGLNGLSDRQNRYTKCIQTLKLQQ